MQRAGSEKWAGILIPGFKKCKKKRICSDTNHEIEHNIKTKNFLVFNDHVQLVNVATCIFINDVMIQDTLNKLVQKINTKKE